MRSFIFIAVLLISITSASAHAGDSQSVYDRVVTSGTVRCGYFTWPPYIYKDANTGAVSGINYDFMMAIGKILGLKIEWTEEANPGTAITGLETNRYDVMCATLWPDAARLKHALLTAPIMHSSVYAIARKDDARFDKNAKTINDPSVTIAALDGDITYSIATDDYAKAKIMSLPQNSDGSLLLQSLVTKKADITFIDKGMLGDFNRTNGNALKVVEGIPPAYVFPECLAVKKHEIALRMLLDHAIQLVVDNGTADRLVAKYPNYSYFAPRKSWAQTP